MKQPLESTPSLPLGEGLPPVAIVTRHAIHGGVETIVDLQRRLLQAPVFVAGGDRTSTCPFPYRWVSNPLELEECLRPFPLILFHWLPRWAEAAVSRVGARTVEFVHSLETAPADSSTATATITHSTFIAGNLSTRRNTRVWIAPHGIDVPHPPPPPGLWWGGPTTLSPGKGLDLVVEAAAKLGRQKISLPLRFYGEGNERRTLERLSKRLKVAVEWLPAVPSGADRLREFAGVLLPSRHEGFPVVALEALARNLTVVASRLPWTLLLESLAQASGRTIPLHTFSPDDADGLAEVLAKLANGPVEPTGAWIVRDHFSPQQHLAALRQCLVWALQQSPSAPTPPPPVLPDEWLSGLLDPSAPTRYPGAVAALEYLWRFRLAMAPRGSRRENAWRSLWRQFQ